METLKRIWNHKDLRKRILYTLILLVIFRILAHIPVPGVDIAELKNFFSNNQLFGLLNLFSGSTMENFSLVMMGVGPYITSSIIFQLLVIVVPQFEQLQKEGEYGRQKINHYTRIATVPLAAIQSYAMITLLKNQGIVFSMDFYHLILTIITMTAGTMLVMWLGELISENGIGNGISLIISLGIITGVPTQIMQTLAVGDTSKIIGVIIFVVVTILITTAIVFMNEGERQIPITYARRVRGHRTTGGVETNLPIRILLAGVIPIIFAMSLMIFPGVISKFLENAKSAILSNTAHWIGSIFQNDLFYGILYFIFVILFTFFYTSVVFQPKQVAENLQKQGGFVPGLRPGNETAQYINNVLYKVTFSGAIFLALIAVLPFIVQAITDIKTLVLGGTGILIVVAVVIETMRQINAQLAMHTYDNY